MAYQIEITAQADAEMDEACDWIARDSPQNAARWYRGLLDKIATLAERPDRCPVAPESKSFGVEIRELLYGTRRSAYRILFTIRDGIVSVLHVRHAARRFLDEP